MFDWVAARLSGLGQSVQAAVCVIYSSRAVRASLLLLLGGLVVVIAMKDCESAISRWWSVVCSEADVAIFIQSPEVYTRARLLNDRNEQKNWLTGQLELTKDATKFITLEEEERRTIAQSLQIGAKASAQSISGELSTAAPKPSGNEEAAAPRVAAQKNADAVGLERRPTGPLFESMNKFREDIRSELSRIQLDDRHDLGGNTAYTLRFPTSVIGDFTGGNVGVVFVKAKLPAVDFRRVEPALESWRSHVQRVYSSSLRDIALSLSGSADQSLEDLGLSSSDFREYVVHKMLCKRIGSFCPPHERNLHLRQDPSTKVMATRDGRTLLPDEDVSDDTRDEIALLASEVRAFLSRYLQLAGDLNGVLEEWAFYRRLDTLGMANVALTATSTTPRYLQAMAGCFGLPEVTSLPPVDETGPPQRSDLVAANEYQILWRYTQDGKNWRALHPCPRSDRGTAWIASAVFRLVEARNFGDQKSHSRPNQGIQQAIDSLENTLEDMKWCRAKLIAEIPFSSAPVPRLPQACQNFIVAPADMAPAAEDARRISSDRWGVARVQELRCAMADFRAYQATWRRYLSPAGHQISFSDFFDVIAIRYGHQGCDLEVRVKHRGDRFPDRGDQPLPRTPQTPLNEASCEPSASLEVGSRTSPTAYVRSLCAIMRELSENHTIFALSLLPAIQKRTVNKDDQRKTNFGGQLSPNADLASISASLASQVSNMRTSKDSVATVAAFVPHRSKSPLSPGVKSEVASDVSAFGWVFLPDSSNVRARQFDLSAALSLPGWVTEIDIEVNTCVGTHRDLSSSIAAILHVERASDQRRDPPLKCQEVVIGRVRLPGDPAEITRKLNLDVFNEPHIKVMPGINDYKTSGPVLRAGHRGVLLIPGRRLWKNTYVTLGDQLASEISILPDMEGIIATFRCVHVPNEIALQDWHARSLGEVGQGGSGPMPRAVKLARVWTSEGATVPILVQIEQIGPVSLCEDQEPIRLLEKPQKPAQLQQPPSASATKTASPALQQ